jgi:hypothetical protein
MLYYCKSCDSVVAHGCLPTASCGLLMMTWLAMGCGVVFGFVRAIADARHWPQWHWWISGPAGFLCGLLVAIILAWVVQLLERLTVFSRRCPKCGSRRWSKGFTSGFGL